MKAAHSSKTTTLPTSDHRLTFAGFSRRMARPSIGNTVASLTSNLRLDDLWDFSLVERLQAPITRRHY